MNMTFDFYIRYINDSFHYGKKNDGNYTSNGIDCILQHLPPAVQAETEENAESLKEMHSADTTNTPSTSS